MRLGPGEFFFEDIGVGDDFATSAVTVTDAHIVAFAGLAGDLFDVHMDETFAREKGFEGRIAHGLLILSLVDGLKTRCTTRLMSIAALGWNWSFRTPVYPGDRIRTRFELRAKRLTRSGDRGILTLGVVVTNQSDIVVQEGEHLLMVGCREVPDGTSNSQKQDTGRN